METDANLEGAWHNCQTQSFEEAIHIVCSSFHKMKICARDKDDEFSMRYGFCNFARTRISSLSVRTKSTIEAIAPPADVYYHLAVKKTGSESVEHLGENFELSNKQACIISPTAPTRWHQNDHYEDLSLFIERRTLERHFELMTGIHLKRPLEYYPRIDLSSQSGQKLYRNLNHFAEESKSPGSLLGSSICATSVQDLLLNFLLTEFNHNYSLSLEKSALTPSSRAVLRTEEYMREHATEDISIRQLTHIAGVSMRSLQRAFKQHREHTPLQFLKKIRLQLAYKRLSCAEPELTVTHVALTSGFSHLGAFSVEYRKRFGESPSATLARAHCQGATPVDCLTA